MAKRQDASHAFGMPHLSALDVLAVLHINSAAEVHIAFDDDVDAGGLA